MSVQKIIKEAMEKNPLNLKEALQEELKARMSLALEAKMKVMEDEDELEEATKSVDDFMDIMKIKSEPEQGTRMNFGGYPFDYDGYEDGDVYLAAVDKEAAKGLAAALKKKGFKVKAKNLDVTVMLSEQVNLGESASKYGVDTGPLMKASSWIKRQKLSKMVQEDDLRGENLAVGYLEKFDGKRQPVAVVIGKADETSMKKHYFEKGLNKPHTFYYDTGRGHRQTDETITITGIVKISKDGEVETTGNVNMNASTTLTVFK